MVLDVYNFYSELKDAGKSDVVVINLYEINTYIQNKRVALEKERGNPFGRDEPLLQEDARKLVLTKYYNFLDIFSKADSDILPPRREGVDYRINLKPGARPEDLHYSPLYKISLEKLEVYQNTYWITSERDLSSLVAPYRLPRY